MIAFLKRHISSYRTRSGICLLLILLFGFYLRTYRLDMLLRFYYDQGRDAIVIHDIIHKLRPVLVGPTTGLAGIMRGPAFYYLLLPAYLVGRGDPVIAAVWLQLLNTFGLFVIFLIGKKIHSPLAGIVAAFLVGFSQHIVDLSRWLSNPSPILTSVPIMVYALLRLFDPPPAMGEKPTPAAGQRGFWWYIIALMLGLNLQFEIASEFWFLPAFVLLLLLYPQIRPAKKTFAIASLIFLSTLIPQIVFDLRHGGIMRLAILKQFTSGDQSSFTFTLEQFISRSSFYLNSFTTLFVPKRPELIISLLALLIPVLISTHRRLLTPVIILFAAPLFFLLPYSGNQGNFYSYYLIGLFPIFLIIVAVVLAHFLTHRYLFFIPLILIFLFTRINLYLMTSFLSAGVDGPEHISLGNQLQAIDWIYQQAGDTPFNVDIYVPPVIPYSYDYLFSWYGPKQYRQTPATDTRDLLFTLSEVDPPNVPRHQAWLDNRSRFAEARAYARFGGVWVEKRIRKPVKSKP